jgi:hypothetical protein
VLPTVNRFGGSKRAVADAVRFVEEMGGPDDALLALARRHGVAHESRFSLEGRIERAQKDANPEKLPVTKEPGALHTLASTERLALEMALHEESERRAMQGELEALAAAWQEAEQIAKIADEMLQPAVIGERLTALRGQVAPGASHDGEARGA